MHRENRPTAIELEIGMSMGAMFADRGKKNRESRKNPKIFENFFFFFCTFYYVKMVIYILFLL